jgi:endonuclease/exonuclease/phosphatase family metal-dependent hydrolase
VHVICVHLGLAEAHRQQQLELLCQIVRDEVPADAPLIVAGDFNDWRRRANDILELEGAACARSSCTPTASPPRPSRRASRCCRWTASTCATASVHLPVVLPRKPWSHLSDHAPLVAEIHL